MAEQEDPAGGGASSVESWDDVPPCTFDPETGFAFNASSLDTLRWHSYLRPGDDAAGSLEFSNEE